MYRDREMACPRCAGKLVGYPARDKWRCAGCGGVLAGPDEVPPEVASGEPPRPSRRPDAPLGCPLCGVEMQRLVSAEIRIEHCTRDGLTWFDSGELGYLSAYFAEEP
jgi:PHP family Zn ribbon phosphoesterase